MSNLYGRQFKTNQQFISQKELSHYTISDYLTILDRDKTENKLLLFYKSFVSDTNKYVIENNTLTVSDDLGIVTKIEFNGLKRKDISNEFKLCNVYAKPKCKDCYARFYCSGGCAANSYSFHGSITDTYDIGCELQKKRIECAIMIKAALAG